MLRSLALITLFFMPFATLPGIATANQNIEVTIHGSVSAHHRSPQGATVGDKVKVQAVIASQGQEFFQQFNEKNIGETFDLADVTVSFAGEVHRIENGVAQGWNVPQLNDVAFRNPELTLRADDTDNSFQLNTYLSSFEHKSMMSFARAMEVHPSEGCIVIGKNQSEQIDFCFKPTRVLWVDTATNAKGMAFLRQGPVLHKVWAKPEDWKQNPAAYLMRADKASEVSCDILVDTDYEYVEPSITSQLVLQMNGFFTKQEQDRYLPRSDWFLAQHRSFEDDIVVSWWDLYQTMNICVAVKLTEK